VPVGCMSQNWTAIGWIEAGNVQLLTRTGLDWTTKYPAAVAALKKLKVKSAYIDGELCGVDDAGLPNFELTQQAHDGAKGVYPYVLRLRPPAPERQGPYGQLRHTG
jgi:hypothetical protein